MGGRQGWRVRRPAVVPHPGAPGLPPALTRAEIEARSPGAAHTLTGDIRLHAQVWSPLLGRARNITVYLPPGYDSHPRTRYPVFYLHDGQNLFDGATAFVPGQEWRLDETAERLIRTGRIEPIIIVGIDHAGPQRLDEFGPVRDTRHRAGGLARLYGRMIVEELKPLVDRTYRTKPGQPDTGLGGSSMGGLATLFLGLEFPDVFGRLAVLSPSVWWQQRAILQRVQALPQHLPLRIWLDIGTKEGHAPLADARALRDALVARGWREGRDLMYLEAEGAGHSEAAWAARVAPMLEFLFPPRPQRGPARLLRNPVSRE
jgi:predicted alpha/beta superfamily hydrolase